MKYPFKPKEERKNILFITDDIRTPSGVAHIAKTIIKNSYQHFNWSVLCGLSSHPEKGYVIDYSPEIGEDSSVTLYPTDNYGTIGEINNIISHSKIDAVLLITDPRSHQTIWDNERVIRKQCPIIYYTIWDNFPTPQYNKPYYESCDALLCINQINLAIANELVPHKFIDYVPHGLDETIFKPIKFGSKDYLKLSEMKRELYGDAEVNFSVLYNSRNIRRKNFPDLMFGWKLFQEKLTPEERNKVRLVAKTDKKDPNGTDLIAVENMLFPNGDSNIIWVDAHLSPEAINLLYNATDCTCLVSSNEGWGLSLTESLLAGKPFIANVTGGMQDQMRFEDHKGDWIHIKGHTDNYGFPHGAWVYPVYPQATSIVGSLPTPYIFDDRIAVSNLAATLKKMYKNNHETRKSLGELGRQWAIGDEAGFTATKMTERIIDGIEKTLELFQPRNNYDIIRL